MQARLIEENPFVKSDRIRLGFVEDGKRIVVTRYRSQLEMVSLWDPRKPPVKIPLEEVSARVLEELPVQDVPPIEVRVFAKASQCEPRHGGEVAHRALTLVAGQVRPTAQPGVRMVVARTYAVLLNA